MNKILILLAIFGIAFAIFTVIDLSPDTAKLEPPRKPSMVKGEPIKTVKKDKKTQKKEQKKPKVIAALGIIESQSEEISVASHISGVASEVLVKSGKLVKRGEVLLTIDKRRAVADVEVAKARVEVAKSRLQRATSRLRFYQNIRNKEAIVKQELEDRRNVVLERLADLDEALAGLTKASVDLDLHDIEAPIDGRVLKVNVQNGEFINAGRGSKYLLMASDEGYNVRAQIDEYSLSDLKKTAQAKIVTKGANKEAMDAQLVRIEPYVEPKRNLSGNARELVDTRVLEVIFKITNPNPQLFIGQQVDVYIKN